MTLTEAVPLFETNFEFVTADEKAQYLREQSILWSGGCRGFEETPWALFADRKDAVEFWYKAAEDRRMTGYPNSQVSIPSRLKWIVKPELLEFQITIADRLGRHRAVNNRFAVKSQFVVED